jgi:hypothetical protein
LQSCLLPQLMMVMAMEMAMVMVMAIAMAMGEALLTAGLRW